MWKSIEVARALLEEMASNNYHWSSETGTPKRIGEFYDVDSLNLIASKIDAFAQCFDKLVTPSSGNPSGSLSKTMFEVRALYEIYGM